MSSHQSSRFLLGAPSVLLTVSLMLYAESNTSSLLLHAVCYSSAYVFKDCISSLGHSNSLWFTVERTWIRLRDAQTTVGKPLFISYFWGSFEQFVISLEVFTVLIELRASPGCISPCLRNIQVCSPAETQIISVVPNSTACFPAS